jgi:hypothetical protein
MSEQFMSNKYSCVNADSYLRIFGVTFTLTYIEIRLR